jgi:type I restriction enzyme, R subunit
MSPSNYTEEAFESHIEKSLLAVGYHSRCPQDYDRGLALIPAEVVAFIRASQPDEYAALQRQYGPDTDKKLCLRLAGQLDKHGALRLLRQGFSDRGVKLRLAFFQPASGLNPEHQALYEKNRLVVVRQLKYRQDKESSIDLVLFLNGMPIITAELKNSLTGQTVENAVVQYRTDRRPNGEPLLRYRRCLVHFALGNEAVQMTTRLQGKETRFLPFNKDTVNPVNPLGHKTAYMWEDILLPDTLLDLIGCYLHEQHETEKVYDPAQDKVVEQVVEKSIFPRYHQLDVVRRLLAAVQQEGVGHSYLVQHSAGSGKSNSIAWLAHHLANFYQHPSDTQRLFDSVVVVSDRRVLDKQLRDTIKQFEQQPGVVVAADKHSGQLKQALEQGKAIIVTTLQKFPVIAEHMSQLKGSRFAVIIDEAHSSQSGESARKLHQTLSVGLEAAEAADAAADEPDAQDEIVAQIRARRHQPHISYFAFTATPKNKTLELFGRKNDEGHFVAFHRYSMRQAIEEGFIKDVLKNYTTYKRYFRLVKTIEDDERYDKRKATRVLVNYVDLSPHAVDAKAAIMLDHFLEVTAQAVQGRGRAMVVTRSRLHAVRFYQALRKLMVERNLPYRPLVAFSGTVKDPDSGAAHTENSLNCLGPKTSIPDAFKMPDYRLLVVANKFQTGFDEPLLHTMYVDKRLDGLQAVQTLSRLNRTAKGKDNPVVIDFVNDPVGIQEAFQPYYQTTFLEEETDPNKLYDLQTELEGFEVFGDEDVETFCAIFFNKKLSGERLQPVLDQVIVRWRDKSEEERERFRSTLQSFVRLYGFISQIFTFEDVDLEKLYVFGLALRSKLPRREERLPYEVLEAVDLDSLRLQETFSGDMALSPDDGIVHGIGSDVGALTEDQEELLAEIIKVVNETYGAELTEDDKLDLRLMSTKIFENEALADVMQAANTPDDKRKKFGEVFDQVLLAYVTNRFNLYEKLSQPQVSEYLKTKWYQAYQREVAGG